MANKQQLALLKSDIIQWNEWRKNNPSVKINLGKANLKNVNLNNANLNNADLNNADLESVQLKYANLNNAYLGNVHLPNARLKNTNLENANLNNVFLYYANLENVNLKNAFLYCANLEYANLENANLENANLNNANLKYANLNNANLENANLKDANLENANLENANLENTNLIRCKALKTNFNKANLTGACIEDWHINDETNFDGVICDYIYLKFDWNPIRFLERRPSDESEIFAPGDFKRLIEKSFWKLDQPILEAKDDYIKSLKADKEFLQEELKAMSSGNNKIILNLTEIVVEKNKQPINNINQYHYGNGNNTGGNQHNFNKG